MERMYTHYMSGKTFVDHVYANGEVVRIDKSAAQQADLLAPYNFSGNVLWAGSTNPYKLYTNNTLSVYCLSSELPLPKAFPGTVGLYGVKIDTVTNEKWYKLEDHSYSGTYDVKTETYTEDGTLVGVDYYWVASVESAKTYAETHALTFPVPESQENNVWLWGAYYALGSTPLVMKAYVEVE